MTHYPALLGNADQEALASFSLQEAEASTKGLPNWSLATRLIGEETAEVVMSCKDDVAEEIAGQAADLFYHTLVALTYHKVDIKAVYRKLQERRR
jgi:phosphoribosyl-ATP pyrophosphohydrolase